MKHENLADDEFMYAARRAPSPLFAARLHARLREIEPAAAPRFNMRWAAVAASAALVSLAFTLPSVRAGAAALLDFFRAEHFAAVAFDPERFRGIESNLNVSVDEIHITGTAASYAQLAEAGAAAGISARSPTWLPYGWMQKSIEVTPQFAGRVTTSSSALREVLEPLNIDDLTIPESLDGYPVSVRVGPIVQTTYEDGTGRSVSFVQARIPDVQFPAGLDLSLLAEIGLRALGLEQREAHRFAQSVDWRTTLLVPVPTGASTFRPVDVQGRGGLLVEAMEGAPGERQNRLLWSDGMLVYTLRGALPAQDLMTMAQSLQ